MKEHQTCLVNQMGNELRAFQKLYPLSTSADLQTFLKGYQAAMSVLETYHQIEQGCSVKGTECL